MSYLFKNQEVENYSIGEHYVPPNPGASPEERRRLENLRRTYLTEKLGRPVTDAELSRLPKL